MNRDVNKFMDINNEVDYYGEEIGIVQTSIINYLSSKIDGDFTVETKADMLAIELYNRAMSELKNKTENNSDHLVILLGLVS